VESYPLIIVGSGPAGTGTALHLHRRDPALAREALILEKARHPRNKVCAGGLIPSAVERLAGLDIELRVPHVRVTSTEVTTPSRKVELSDGDLCWVIRRAEFDAALVEACRERGLAIREGEAVLALERDGRGVRVRTTGGTYHARMVVGADGSGSIVRRRLVGEDRRRMARAVMCDVPLSDGTWSGFVSQRYDFDFRQVAGGLPGYRWAFPCWIDGRPHVNVGIYSLEPLGVDVNRSLSDYLDAFTNQPARRQAFPIHYYRPGAPLAAPHVLLVGDAAGADPLMGEGISLALEYGALAAAAAQRALETGDFSGAGYQRAVEASPLGKKLRRLCMVTRLFYGRGWRLWFALAERSVRLRTLGIRWYNGIDGWDRRSGWEALRALLTT
jgi:geranylgeranyl reductase family protein